MSRAIHLALTLASLWLVCLGCAGARFEGVVEEEPFAKPTMLLVYDFAVTPEDLVGDALGPSFDAPAPNDEAHAIARELSEAIVAKLAAKGIQTARADGSSAVPQDALLLQGQFVTIEKGSRVARMAIGFGAGQQQLRVQAQMYQWTGTELRRVKQAEARAHGDSAPGMGSTDGRGRRRHRRHPAAGDRERQHERRAGGHRWASSNPRSSGDVIADNLVKFYRERGWL